MDLEAFLAKNRRQIVDEASEAAHHLGHYEREGSAPARFEALYDVLVESITTRDLQPIVAHMREIAEERFASGFDLSEVQSAINLLEESAWRAVLRDMEPADLAEALGLVSTVLGAGKDALARQYVTLASKTGAPSLDLKGLFEGSGA
ncbi:MAG: hypothetical protein ACXVQ6_07860 [Actinomycetota bacterium]